MTAPIDVPILTINTGHLGFLAELSAQARGPRAGDLDDWTVEERIVVVTVMRGDQRLELLCLNEMALHREPITSMCHFEIAVGRHPGGHRRRWRHPLDPDGSTAYALSAGGPVISLIARCCSSPRSPPLAGVSGPGPVITSR